MTAFQNSEADADGFATSLEVLAAIGQVAGEPMPPHPTTADEEYDLYRSAAFRVWVSPTVKQRARVETLARSMTSQGNAALVWSHRDIGR